MREYVKYIFLTLMTAFLLFIYIKNAHYLSYLYINTIITFIVFIFVLVMLFLGVVWLHKQLSKLSYFFVFEIISCLMLILFFTYSFFTSFFYSDNHLREVGLEKINMYHKVNDPELSKNDRSELIEAVMVNELAYANLNWHDSSVEPVEDVEVAKLIRNFYQFELEVKGTNVEQQLESIYLYTFEREGTDFKISGIQKVEN